MQATEAPPTGLAVHTKNLSRTYPTGVTALEPLDISISAGEFVTLLGPSGCGKSTLLRLIAALDRPSTGGVSIGDSAEHRRDIGYVFQDAHLLPWRTVLSNVALPLELMRVPKSQRLAKATQAITEVGLADAIDRYPAQLSGGMRMRVSLARALITQPRLLLLDEPFAALDEITRQHLDEQLRSLWRQRGFTTIFVTHSTAEATYLANRAIVLSRRPGRVIEDTPIDLPEHRTPDLRGSAAFASQTHRLYEALRQGGA